MFAILQGFNTQSTVKKKKKKRKRNETTEITSFCHLCTTSGNNKWFKVQTFTSNQYHDLYNGYTEIRNSKLETSVWYIEMNLWSVR